MGKLQRYFWPRTALIFYIDGDAIEAAFGFVEKSGVDIQETRTIAIEKKDELFQWHKEIAHTYPKTYVVGILDTLNQGALPGCSARAFAHFGVDYSLVRSLCIENIWSTYVSSIELEWYEEKFKSLGPDFIYSYFALLYDKSRIYLQERPGLFCLHQKGTVFLMVLSKDKVWYAQLLIVPEAKEEEEESIAEEDELAFDLEDLTSEQEIESLENDDMFSGFQEEGHMEEESAENGEALAHLEYGLNLFENIKEAIVEFYHDDRYSHDFIDEVCLFDMGGLDADVARYIEEELFMKVSLHTFDTIDIAARLMCKELEG